MHYLLPRETCVDTYVIENQVDGKTQVTDFFSLNLQGQTCNGSEKYKDMYVAYLYYYGLTVNTYKDMIRQALVTSSEQCNCDAFATYEMMGNYRDILENELGF